jgi:tRNA-splicing ligase RtcB (3'-phosphate/5'-hydroxy nucleic acid ligase)
MRDTSVARMEVFDESIPVFGQADERALNQIRVCARTADKVALMADNHLGYGVPIGGVAAYKDAISLTGVGYDIGCGNKAVRVDMLNIAIGPGILLKEVE